MEEKSRSGRPIKPAIDFIARNKAKVRELSNTRSQPKGLEDQENTHKPSKSHFKPAKTHPAKGLSEPAVNPAVEVEQPVKQIQQGEETHSVPLETTDVVAYEEQNASVPLETTEVVACEEQKTEASKDNSTTEINTEPVPTPPSPAKPSQFSSPLPHSPVPPTHSAPQRAPSPTADSMVLSNPPPALPDPLDLVIVDPCPKRSRDSAPDSSTLNPSPKRFKRLSKRESQS
jgi:hypothetical protein